MVPASSPASLNSEIGRPPPATSFAQTHDIVHSDLFVSCIPSFLRNLSLLINYQDEIWRKHEQYQGAVNDVGGGNFKARKRERHDGNLETLPNEVTSDVRKYSFSSLSFAS
jgi:hypothetical protein